MSPNRTVLIVDDTDTAATALELALLAVPGLSIRLVASARDALRILSAGDGISALITDLNMPQMDGFALIERVRADTRYARLPIMVISGDTDPRTPERVRHLGVNAFFAKPYSPAEVRQKLEQLLNVHHAPESTVARVSRLRRTV
jgi:CheY-like chemotaxis protein